MMCRMIGVAHSGSESLFATQSSSIDTRSYNLDPIMVNEVAPLLTLASALRESIIMPIRYDL